MIYTRPSGNPIELKDTPEMERFASDNGWEKEKPLKKAKKTKKAE